MISMTDWIEARGMGQEADPSDVRLSANDLARLGKINTLDPSKSAYSGMGIQQAQELAGQLPSAADLGLVVQQNRQLEAAGGRGYAGNVHNLQGGQTPFEALTQQIASAKGNAQSGGISTPMFDSGNYGDGGDGGRAGAGLSPGETLGTFGKEAFSNVASGMSVKGLTSAGLAAALGAPLGLAGKFGLVSMLTPMGMLSNMGQMAYSGLLDSSVSREAGSQGIDTKSLDMAGYKSLTDKGFNPAFMGFEDEDAFNRIETQLANASFGDRLGIAFGELTNTLGDIGKQATNTGLGGWGGYTSLAALNEAMAADPMFGSVAGLDPTFGGYSPGGGDGSSGDRGGGFGGGRAGSDEGMSGQNDAGGLGGGGFGGW